jgi:peroxiredoxin
MSIKQIIIVAIAFLVISCENQSSEIRGKITGSKGKILYFEQVDLSKVKALDSVKLNNTGRFHFSTKVKMPDFYQLRLDKRIISLLVKKGDRIKINANGQDILNSLKIYGSFDSENLFKLNRYLAETKNQLDSVTVLYNNAAEDSTRQRLYDEYMRILESHRKYSITYILTYTNSLTSIYALYQQIAPDFYVFYKTTDLQFFKILSDSLGKYYPKSKHVIALRNNTNAMLNNYHAQILLKKANVVETSLPKVELTDINGKIRKLSSFKGKYVLLTFWASWDEASIEQNLRLKEVYKQFRNRNFEILQVSFDNSPEAWKRAVRFDELPWVSVIDTTFPNSRIAINYNVQQLPANYLIDQDNITIIDKNLNPDQLYEKLLALLK